MRERRNEGSSKDNKPCWAGCGAHSTEADMLQRAGIRVTLLPRFQRRRLDFAAKENSDVS